MTSADFLQFVVTTHFFQYVYFMRLQDLPGYSHVLSLFTCRIYPKRFRAAIGLRLIRELCLWLTLPAAGRIRVFHPIERALTGRTKRELQPTPKGQLEFLLF